MTRGLLAHACAGLLLALLASGCTHSNAATLPAKGAEPGVVDHACKVDADCAIKDVGNCCGAYPQCVNRDSETFPAQVKARCAADGMAGVCGFPVLSGCTCVANRCEGVNAPQSDASLQ